MKGTNTGEAGLLTDLRSEKPAHVNEESVPEPTPTTVTTCGSHLSRATVG